MSISQLIEADPYLVAFSLNNPRKRRGLDIDSLNALAESIKAQGLAQPILVRPLPGSRTEETFRDREEGHPLPAYELVCGERRLRATRIAEQATIPMLVRDLDDEAALELQLVENIEREDLDPLEEAEGFELLRTRLGYTVQQIADRIGRGKGASYVRKTMTLLKLTPEARDAMYDGHLGRSTGLIVAHYPEARQAEVVAYIRNLAVNGDPAPFRDVSPKVFTRFNLDLKGAVWKLEDADLVPAAGACSTCPKRTGANEDLFGDPNGPDSCADADCFAGKRAAHVEQVKLQAQKDGFKVIDGDEAEAAFFSPHSKAMRGFVPVDDVAYTEKGDDDSERAVTFGDALRSMGKKAPKPRIIINPFSGEAVKVITNDLAEKLTPQNEGDDERETGSRAGKHDDRPDDERAMDDWNVRRAVLLRVFDSIRNRDRTDSDMLLIARALFIAVDDSLPSIENYLSWTDLEDAEDQPALLQQKLEAMPAAELAAVLTMAAAETVMTRYGFSRQQELQVARDYGIDVLAVRDKVAEDLEREVAGADADAEEPEPADGDLDTAIDSDSQAEPEATAGGRVRMKENLRTAGSKFRKISGREGVLLKQLDDGDWMFKSDGGKDQARVTRDEFIVLPAETAREEDNAERRADVGATIDPVAAWPFPKAK